MNDLKRKILKDLDVTEFNDLDDHSWWEISRFYNLDDDFIREFPDQLDWQTMSEFQSLSESIISEFRYDVDWITIYRTQKLSEDFIKLFDDYVYWFFISSHQSLSKSFILENRHSICFNVLPNYINCSTTISVLVSTHKAFLEDIPVESVLSYYSKFKKVNKFDLEVLPKDIHTEVLAICKL